jgi:hypothetical protein
VGREPRLWVLYVHLNRIVPGHNQEAIAWLTQRLGCRGNLHVPMNEITPRWEWRSFGRRFGEAESRLAALTPTGVQERDEVYLLSGAGDNVKVRDACWTSKCCGRSTRTVSNSGHQS